MNALTNIAFLIAATIMWRRVPGIVEAQILAVILFAIGVGSFLFHTFATAWASAADVAPIGIFILVYLFLATRDFLGLKWWAGGIAVILFIPYAFVMVQIFDRLPFFHVSNFYWTVPVLLFGYALVLRRKAPATAGGLIVGAAILTVSISIRSLDIWLCPTIPLGVHYFWHVLNAIMLGWMIEVYRRHRTLAAPSHQG